MAVGTLGSELTPDQLAAIQAADSPDGSNPFATVAAVGGVGPIQAVVRALTSAEVLTLFSDPIELVPAVPGTVYQVLSFSIYYHAGPTPYSPSSMFVGQILTTPIDGWQIPGDALLQLVDQLAYANPPDLNAGFDAAPAVGKPLYIAADAGDMADGDGTIDATVTYRAIDVSRPGIPFKLEFGVQPNETAAGDPITPAVTVRVLDNVDELVDDDDTTIVTMLSNGPPIDGTTVVTVVDGVATFDDLSVAVPTSDVALNATSPGLSPGPSDLFEVT